MSTIMVIESHNYEEKYKEMMQARTGIDYSGIAQVTNLTLQTFVETKNQIISDLKCSYAYSCLQYVKLTRHIVEYGIPRIFSDIKESSFFYFTEISIAMLTSMKSCEQLNAVEFLWWFYFYTHGFSHIINQEKELNQTDSFIYINDTIEKIFTDFITSNECDQNNSYNTIVNYTDVYTELPNDDNWNSYHLRRSEIIEKLKLSILDQFDANNNFANAINEDAIFCYGRIAMPHLLYEHIGIKNILNEFGEIKDWKRVLDNLREEHKPVFDSNEFLTKRFVALGRLYKKILIILEINMLQILLRHLYYIEYYINEKIKKTNCLLLHCSSFQKYSSHVKYVNTLIAFQINHYKEFTKLKDDRLINEIVAKLDIKNKNLYDDDDTIFVHIEERLKELSSELYNCQLSYPRKFDFDMVKKLMENKKRFAEMFQMVDFKDTEARKPFNESLYNARLFVRFSKHTLRNVRFGIIYSFIEFTQNLENTFGSSSGS